MKHVSPAIHRSMPISDIVTFCPEAKGILGEYGLQCFQCAGSEYETLEAGCRTHGYGDEEIDALVTDLNDALSAMPQKPRMLTVTADAARAISEVAKSEGRIGEGLSVIVDGNGGFCMEFRPEPDTGEQTFVNTEVPDIRVFASQLTLMRIGGSTVDFRDGRFKLDLPENDDANHACGCGGSCSCKAKVES